MHLKTYLTIVWRRKWIIVATAAVTYAVAVAGTLMATPVYESSTTLRIPTARRGSADWVDYDVQYANRLMNTYSLIATSGPVLNELKDKLGLDKPPEVEVANLANSELMQITVRNPSPVLARDAATVLAEILVAKSKEQFAVDRGSAQEILSQQLAQLDEEMAQARQEYDRLVAQSPEDTERAAAARRSIELKEASYRALLEQYDQVRIRDNIQANIPYVIAPAEIPDSPSRPNRVFNAALGILVGIIGGVGLAFLFENLDTRLHTTAQIEAISDLPTLATIPEIHKWSLDDQINGNSPESESFRRLRSKILNGDGKKSPKSLAIMSTMPGEGRSTVVASLAAAIAEMRRQVVVVDSDLRRPSLHKMFDLPNEAGLSEVLRGEATLDETLQQSEVGGVYVLTSGRLPADPAAVLGSARMATLVELLTHRFDRVLLDTPALLGAADATVLAPLVDGVLLVVRRGRARAEGVQSAQNQLADIGARSIGLVVNGAERDGRFGY
jgi:non-specific protein-tyrosine kinase